MPRTPIGSRWNTPGRRYAGNWRHNPWINAAHGDLPIESPGSHHCQHNDNQQDRQQRAAVRAWENEGGSLGHEEIQA